MPPAPGSSSPAASPNGPAPSSPPSCPEVDAVVGFAGEADLATVALDPPRRRPRGVRDLLELPRAAPLAPWAYVKVAEGCDRACRFCAIPSFRGPQRSRHPDSLLAECRGLVEAGAAELVLVAQDLAWYGRDVGEPGSLAPLLTRLDRELTPLGLRRLRLLYLYPSEVHGRLVDTMLDTETVVPYFDLSLQHADRALLARMARWGSGDRFRTIIDGIRDRQPDAAFRSSFIVGFPGETEAAHDQLLAFLAAARLDWAGFFAYSAETGTPAATMDGVVPDPVVAEWLAECEDVQAPITAAARDQLVGAELHRPRRRRRPRRRHPRRPHPPRSPRDRRRHPAPRHRRPARRAHPSQSRRSARHRPPRRARRGARVTEPPTPAERARRFGETAIKTPANAVTLVRLLFAVPVLVWILDQKPGHSNWGTFCGWLVLWVTDWLDGWLARRDGTTRSGAFLDPLADKLLVTGGLVALAIRGDFAWLPVLLIVAREVGVSIWRALASRRGVSVPARKLGKWKVNVQFLAVAFVLFPPTEHLHGVATIAVWVSVAFSLLSALDLVLAARRGTPSPPPAPLDPHPLPSERRP